MRSFLAPSNLPPARLLCVMASVLLFGANLRAADRDYVEDADFTKTVAISFDGTSATVSNPAGVTITYGANSSSITVSSTLSGVEYILSGTSTSGYVQITSTYACKVKLNGANVTSPNGPAVSVISAARAFIVLADGTSNTLSDNATYTRSGSGALYASGPLILSGKGTLTVAGLKSHAISSGSYIRALDGDVQITSAVKDGFHANAFFQMDRGSISVTATGDGIDAGSGYIVVDGGSIDIRSTVDDTKGMVCDGTFTVNGGTISMTVNGLQSKALSSKAAMTINGGALVLNLAGGVYLETVTGTSGTYSDPAYCTALKCDADITIGGGSVTITHTGIAGKGISADGNVLLSGGTVDIATSGGPSDSYTDSASATDVASADCVTCDGNLTISGGVVNALSTGASGDCLSSDLAVNVTGGVVNVTGKGAKSKGLKSGGAMTIGGGTLTFAMSGAVVLESVTTTTFDPAYCVAIKCETDLAISGGTVSITHSGQAGKGISADGSVTMSDGTVTITTSGANTASFKNASNTTDMASADCLKADGTLTITGGTLTATSTGTAGDAISCDGAAIIGTLGVSATPVISANTTGAHVLLSGSGMNADYVNPKAFSAAGNVTIDGGIFKATTQQDGGEGLESKASLTINGGTIEITSYDDAINAATKVTVNGGTIYCYASGNDGIDSNGTFLFTGGTIVTSGTSAPEEGFDCDSNNFTITGGTLIGTGGASSTPTASTSTQRSVVYKGPGSANVILQVKSAAGNNVVVYKLPRTYGTNSSAMTMLFSNSALAAGSTYSIISGATVSGGTEFHGLYTGATVTGGTTLKTFTPTAMVTTVQ